MELSQHQLQIVMSVVLILGAGVVALVCDLLKRSNEQLRELAIELKVLRDEDQKRFQMVLPQGTDSFRPEQTPAPAPPEVQTVAEVPKLRQRPAKPSIASASRERKRPISPDALAVMERGAKMASAPRPRHREERPERPEIERIESITRVKEVDGVNDVDVGLQTLTPTPKPQFTVSRDWTALLQAQRGAPPGSAIISRYKGPDLLDSFVTAASGPSLPSGFQDGFALSRLADSRRPVSGLVISIGANARNGEVSLPSNVRDLIQSLIGPKDFAAQSGPEEFLLIFPGERGASAQRRLSQVAQQLWDFQLRNLGSFSPLFSWGAVEVHSESIDEAIASAKERMEETRRSRRMMAAEPLAQAV